MALNRSDTILKYIVEYFIKKAQPVGSHTLIDEYKLPYSSATIRNEMFALEKMGYIEKTHSSSGRVPSAAGPAWRSSSACLDNKTRGTT